MLGRCVTFYAIVYLIFTLHGCVKGWDFKPSIAIHILFLLCGNFNKINYLNFGMYCVMPYVMLLTPVPKDYNVENVVYLPIDHIITLSTVN